MGACATCGAENPAAASFCGRCGAPLSARPACDRCGAALPVDARFCPACGHRVADPRSGGEERKLVTILFADMVGSTELGEQLDPEQLSAVLDSYFAALRREIEAEGGTVEKFIGDAVVAVFGVPTAHEDDPTRALRAGLRMRRSLDTLNRSVEQDHGIRLGMRIGVNTGEVIARASADPGETFVTGDAVNVAARLEQGADEGQILVGERTARSVKGLRLERLGPLALKGKRETVGAFVLLDDDVGQPRTAERIDARLYRTRMVGRAVELDMVRSVFDRCIADRRPQLVTVYGDAGVGKTRFVEEFARWTEGLVGAPLVITGRCLPYGEGVTYWPLGEMLKAQAGILDTDPPDLALEKIHKFGEELITGDVSADPPRAIAALAYTIGLEDPSRSLSGSDPREVRDDLRIAWRSFFSALARSASVVVVVEDIHWADPALLDLLDDAAERSEGALLFMCPARPELTGRRPDWGGGRWNSSSLLLEPLSDDEATQLFDLLVERDTLADDFRERIIERAGGNPFFLEEIVQRLIDDPASAERLEIPDTVQGVLAARIDLLTPLEKTALQSAAVVGRTFWNGAVRALLELDPGTAELGAIIARLEERGLVHARTGSSIVGEQQFSFRHILIKDVAYESLPRRDRAKAHAMVAAWIEGQTKEREREFAELLTHHYQHAYRSLSAEVRPDPEELERMREKALGYALIAASEARNKLALEQAERFGSTALALSASPSERCRALETLGLTYVHDYQGDKAWASFKEAIDLIVDQPQAFDDTGSSDLARLCAQALEIARRAPGTMRHRISPEEEQHYLDVGLGAAGPGDSEERTRLLTVSAFTPSSGGEDDPERAIATGEEAAAMAKRLGRPELESAALDGITSTYHSIGRYGAMEDPIRRRLALASNLTDPYEVGDIYAMASWWALNTGRYREALDLADRGLARAMPTSPVYGLYCLDFRAAAHFRLGDWDGVLADVVVADEMLGDRRESPPGVAPMHLAMAAFIHEARGDAETADRFLDLVRRLERAEETLDPVLAHWQARLLSRRGRFDDARAMLERTDVAEDRRGRDEVLEAWCDVIADGGSWPEAARAADDATRHAAWAGVPPLSLYSMRLRGRASAAGGNPRAAAELLTAAGDGFEDLGAVWESAVCRLELAELLVSTGEPDRGRRLGEDVAQVFRRVRSSRELERAERLLGGGA